MDRSAQKLKFFTGVHHKQNLRSQIDQSCIDEIEISPTPSSNYQKAYQSLYQDELQKSVHLHDKKKLIEQNKRSYDVLVSNQHKNIFAQGQLEPLQNSLVAINVHNLNYRNVDYMNYDLLKDTRALDHTLRNYNGGQMFYKNCDQHLLKQKNDQQNLRRTLLKQLNDKQRQKNIQSYNKRQEQSALKNCKNISQHYRKIIEQNQNDEKIKHREIIIRQIQQQKQRKQQKSLFNYNNEARHNPITNPIQYHIDNPYILKQIQNRMQGYN